MATSASSAHLCWICHRDVPLETAKTDEQGNAVHERCYVLKALRPAVLSGWKQIADYLQKGVRTIQRYERDMRLPIHRPAGKARASVIASKLELDEWVSRSPSQVRSVPSLTPVAQRFNSLKAEFLQIDSRTALTFSGIALSTNDREKKDRATLTARKALHTIVHLRRSVYLSDSESDYLDGNLARLKSELRMLGQNV